MLINSMPGTTGNPAAVVIAGSGRSGTTWVLDSLAQPNRLRTVFEPLNSQCVSRAALLDSSYLAHDQEDPKAQALLAEIFRGELRSVWARYRINPHRLNPLRSGWKPAVYNFAKLHRHKKTYCQPDASGLAVKFIRANLLLPWMCTRFQLRALLVVRHPCAVIASRLALGGPNWEPANVVDKYCNQRALTELIAKNFPPIDFVQLSPAAALAWVWCVENVLPMQWASEYGYQVVFYEELLASPHTTWPAVAAGLALDSVPGSELLESPSQQVSKGMKGKPFDVSHVGRWRAKLSSEQTVDIDRILKMFDVRHYCVSDPMPCHNAPPRPDA